MANAPQWLGRSQSRLCLLRWSHEINLIMVLLMAHMMMGGVISQEAEFIFYL